MTLAMGAALLFGLATAVVAGFQIALAAGAPWGNYAMGGRYPGRFPPALRVGALLQALVLVGLVVVVLSDADVALPGVADRLPWAVWLAVAFSAVSVVLNAITRSAVERRMWLPVAVVMLLSSLVVAFS